MRDIQRRNQHKCLQYVREVVTGFSQCNQAETHFSAFTCASSWFDSIGPLLPPSRPDPSKPKLEDHAILNACRRITKLILQDSYNRTNVVSMLAISSLSYISAF